MQLRHPMHLEDDQWTWISLEMLSGLWHHTQRKGHPLKNTVLLMPGPSSVDIRWMRRIVPSIFSSGLFMALPFDQSDSWLILAMSSFCSSRPTLVKYALYPVILTSRDR